MYISDSFNPDLLGCKITSINNLKSYLILQNITKHLTADGNNKWSKYSLIGNNFPLFYTLYVGSFDKYYIDYIDLEKNEFSIE